MSEPIAEGWTTLDEAASIVGYSPTYVGRLARKGRIQSHRVGHGSWLVNLADLLKHKAQMQALGDEKHNPWRDDLAASGRGRQPDPEGRCIRCAYHSHIDGCGYDPGVCQDVAKGRKG